jgi:hypothetical protein
MHFLLDTKDGIYAGWVVSRSMRFVPHRVLRGLDTSALAKWQKESPDPGRPKDNPIFCGRVTICLYIY